MSLYDLPEDHFQTIYNPIDLSLVAKLRLEEPEKPLDLDPAVSLIVSLGRLSPEKGHDHLLKALSLLRRRRKDFLCLIIGDGESSRDIVSMIEQYDLGDNVRLLGAVKNPYPYLARAKSLILTSKFESFALVLVEAMASGAIPISVNCPTGPGEVLDQGRAGILVPPEDENALAGAIEDVLWSRQNKKILAHASSWLKTFDIVAVSSQWERLLTDVFAKGPQRESQQIGPALNRTSGARGLRRRNQT